MKKCYRNSAITVLAIMAFMPAGLGTRLLVPITVISVYILYKFFIEIYNYFRLKRIIFNRQAEQSERARKQMIIDTCNKIYADLED